MKEKINLLNIIITAMIGSGVSLFIDFVWSKPFLSTITYVVIALFNVLTESAKLVLKVLVMDIKVWVLLLLVLIVKAVKLVINILNTTTSNEDKKQAFEIYTEDRLKNWRWTWNWVKSGGNWSVRDLKPYCPVCDSTLLEHKNMVMGEYSVECPKCSFVRRYVNDERPDKITQMIIDIAKNMHNEALD